MFLLIVGLPFTGKTTSACTFPGKKLMFSFDGGEASIYNARDKAGNLIVKDPENITILKFHRERHEQLRFVTAKDVDFKSGVYPPHTKQSLEILEKYNKYMDELYKDKCITLDDGAKVGPFSTIILDSLTTFFSLWKDAILFSNKIPQLRIGDYGTLDGILFRQFIPDAKGLGMEWFICIDHETVDKDEITGMITESPIGPSVSMGKLLSKEFDEVWRQRVENGEYLWRTRNHGLFTGCGSRLSLPDPVKPALYEEIKKILEGRKK